MSSQAKLYPQCTSCGALMNEARNWCPGSDDGVHEPETEREAALNCVVRVAHVMETLATEWNGDRSGVAPIGGVATMLDAFAQRLRWSLVVLRNEADTQASVDDALAEEQR